MWKKESETVRTAISFRKKTPFLRLIASACEFLGKEHAAKKACAALRHNE
jgi:hypothetical protein